MTERERLAALVDSAGLRLSGDDISSLLPAWKRYLSLVEELRAVLASEAFPA